MVFGDNSIVPVIMFHSIGLEKAKWSKSNLSEPVAYFISKMEALKKRGTKFWHWGDLYAYMQGSKRQAASTIMLTFDDGYLDNWVFVFPILKKFEIKATIFINPEFVDPTTEPRPNLEDVWAGKLKKDNLQAMGFLNWAEMRIMQESGLIDIQSHALTHTWYFCDSEIIDFHHPQDNYPWLAWNRVPHRKHLYMRENQDCLLPFGFPIFKFEKSLITNRYYPDKQFIQQMIDFVALQGDDFWRNPNWRVLLMNKAKADRETNVWNDSRETKEAYQARVFSELKDSKAIIESQLNKKADFICWPGGGYNTTVVSLAKAAGYKAWTLPSRDQTDFRNCPGMKATQIKRISSMAKYAIYRGQREREYGYTGALYFISAIERHKGSSFYKGLGRVLLFVAILKSMLFKSK